MFWSFVGSVLVGALAGYIASRIMKTDNGFIMNAILGIVGGVVGNIIARIIGIYGTYKFSIAGLLISVGGACLCIWIVRMIRK